MRIFKRKFHLLIVCTANRTRSAYLAAYLIRYLTQYRPGALKQINISSAGTKARRGARVNDVVALIARNNGFSLRRHVSRPLSGSLVKRADLILVMEQEQKDFILKKYPFKKDNVFRLMEFGWQNEDDSGFLDVPDPTGRSADDFKTFIETAHAEADRLVHELVHREII